MISIYYLEAQGQMTQNTILSTHNTPYLVIFATTQTFNHKNNRRGSHANFLSEYLQQASTIGCSVLTIFGIILLFVIILNHDNLLHLFTLHTMTPFIAFIKDRGRIGRDRIHGDPMPSQGTEDFGKWKASL